EQVAHHRADGLVDVAVEAGAGRHGFLRHGRPPRGRLESSSKLDHEWSPRSCIIARFRVIECDSVVSSGPMACESAGRCGVFARGGGPLRDSWVWARSRGFAWDGSSEPAALEPPQTDQIPPLIA